MSDQKRTEDALRKSEERFSKAFRNSPLAITIATEEEGRYLDVNDAFLNMVGRERAEVIGYTGMDIGIWAQESERAEMLRQLAETGRVSEFRKQHKTKAGEIRETEVSADLIELEGQGACWLSYGTSRRRSGWKHSFAKLRRWRPSALGGRCGPRL